MVEKPVPNLSSKDMELRAALLCSNKNVTQMQGNS